MGRVTMRALVMGLMVMFVASSAPAQESAKPKPDKKVKAPAKESKRAAKRSGEVESSRFKSEKGYALVPPPQWGIASPYLSEAQMASLPASLRDAYKPDQTDVLFMDLREKSVGGDFRDNLNAVVIAQPLDPANEAQLAELREVLSQQYGKMFEAYTWVKYGKATVAKRSVIEIHATYKLNNHNLYLYQVLLPSDDKSVVMTCTFDLARKAEQLKACQTSLATFKFED